MWHPSQVLAALDSTLTTIAAAAIPAVGMVVAAVIGTRREKAKQARPKSVEERVTALERWRDHVARPLMRRMASALEWPEDGDWDGSDDGA